MLVCILQPRKVIFNILTRFTVVCSQEWQAQNMSKNKIVHLHAFFSAALTCCLGCVAGVCSKPYKALSPMKPKPPSHHTAPPAIYRKPSLSSPGCPQLLHAPRATQRSRPNTKWKQSVFSVRENPITSPKRGKSHSIAASHEQSCDSLCFPNAEIAWRQGPRALLAQSGKREGKHSDAAIVRGLEAATLDCTTLYHTALHQLRPAPMETRILARETETVPGLAKSGYI